MARSLPFIFGSHYYRAPEPSRECWEGDLRRMNGLGFNSVKYFVQWRWCHRDEDRFYFDDLDQLMELAGRNRLEVTLNILCDMSPLWLFEKHPDAKPVLNDGRVVEPYEVAHRAIGGHPGPCYNHPGALADRKRFVEEAVEHFRHFRSLAMWDVWNEPELCFPQRNADVRSLACYCPSCLRGFREWVERKYGALERLNEVWGRCYDRWDQVEAPRSGQTISDFVDWREFHIETMVGEAAWRLEAVSRKDPQRIRYLHVVPNLMRQWNSVTCATDDFAFAERCDVFAATMNGGPLMAPQVVSAARGKVCYNVESHLNAGMTNRHQRIVELPEILKDFLPQIGLGIRGFLFWQYRPEVLGYESPAWGLVGLEGEDRPVTRAVERFWRTISPHAEALMGCASAPAEVGIWKSRKNEIFHYAVHRELASLADGVEAYVGACYWNSLRFRYIDDRMLSREELGGLKLLVMPSPYYLTEEEASGLDSWVRAGGVLLAEAHLGGYNGTAGRHSRCLPGCGLAQSWGIRETDSTAAGNLRLEAAAALAGVPAAEVRRVEAEPIAAGRQLFPVRLLSGSTAWGALRYATLSAADAVMEGTFDGSTPCVVSRAVGRGTVFYCGTNLGLGASRDQAGFVELFLKAVDAAGVTSTLGARTAPAAQSTSPEAPAPGALHVDALLDDDGMRYIVLRNRDATPRALELDGGLAGRGLFSGLSITSQDAIELPADFVDLFVVERSR